MNNFGILVLFHAKPGRRDDKDHAASSTDLLCSMYNYGLEDENLIILYEIMKDNLVLARAFEESWFQDYLLALEPNLEKPPENIVFTNLWSKHEFKV